MAGDWIKMRNNLWDDPRVSNICDLTGSTEAAVIGSLYWLWAAADEHTESGYMPGLTVASIDRKTGVHGFAAALLSIGWLTQDADGLTINNFEEHNGSSAKKRCADAQRKANVRATTDKTRTSGGQTRTDSGQKEPNRGAREEKRREEFKNPPTPKGEPVGFEEFYAAYPRKEARPKAAKAFAKVKAPLATLLAAVERQRRSEGWQKERGKYIPLPATWLNDERWNDETLDGGEETVWHETKSGVVGKAKELGLNPWNEAEEHWPQFRQRVMQAVKGSSGPTLSLGDLMKLAEQRQGAH